MTAAAREQRHTRPFPPDALHRPGNSFAPAPDLNDWVRDCIISKAGPLYNPDHSHLKFARIGYLWTSVPFVKGQFEVFGTAEQLNFRASGWQKARQQHPFRQWFGPTFEIFNFLITLYAPYAARADNLS